MKMMLVLVAMLGLAAHSVMAAAPVDTGSKGSATGQKQSQESPTSTQSQDPSMVLVPAGEFTMGSPTGDSDEKPAQQVYVDAFSIDKYETTVEQYAAFLQAKRVEPPADWKIINQPAHQKRPATNMDWVDAFAYCKWAGKRLPTEAEWEKAARGTDGRLYPWGNDPPTPLHTNFGKTEWNNHLVLAPVGTYEAGKSPYGAYDMAGNVWEWVNDWYDFKYYQKGNVKNPIGPSTGGTKVIRGGSWYSNPRALRSANRSLISPTDQGLTGIRCAKTP
jgi:formylglycine-generating enzyme required for sulfatase activity